MLRRPNRRSELGQQARRAVESRYRWDAQLAALEPLFEAAMEARGPVTAQLPADSLCVAAASLDCQTAL